MTFYERPRYKQTSGMQEVPNKTTVALEDAVVKGRWVTRIARIKGPDSVVVENHLAGFPGFQPVVGL